MNVAQMTAYVQAAELIIAAGVAIKDGIDVLAVKIAQAIHPVMLTDPQIAAIIKVAQQRAVVVMEKAAAELAAAPPPAA
jgi:hypothetical protein